MIDLLSLIGLAVKKKKKKISLGYLIKKQMFFK